MSKFIEELQKLRELLGEKNSPLANESEISSENTDIVFIDVHFSEIALNKTRVNMVEEIIINICDNYPEPERIKGGPSYIEFGAAVGDQHLALIIFAIGEVLKLWETITPKKMGAEGSVAETLAGQGMIMITGYSGKKTN